VCACLGGDPGPEPQALGDGWLDDLIEIQRRRYAQEEDEEEDDDDLMVVY
jgi:hypothetical protein